MRYEFVSVFIKSKVFVGFDGYLRVIGTIASWVSVVIVY